MQQVGDSQHRHRYILYTYTPVSSHCVAHGKEPTNLLVIPNPKMHLRDLPMQLVSMQTLLLVQMGEELLLLFGLLSRDIKTPLIHHQSLFRWEYILLEAISLQTLRLHRGTFQNPTLLPP